MPDRGDERGRGGTRTLVTGILAGTEWHPAETPQEATQTAREARDLAVRLRPVLSKLAQAPRGGRRRDLDWLPAVEQLAVDAQYFASWWLPRLEGKSAQSWPSWSADGYADWVKRLDAQRVRTLEMVQGTTPVTRIASVTQLRRTKNPETPAAEATPEVESAETVSLPEPPAAEPETESEEGHGGRHALRIMPIRGSGAPTVEPEDAGSIGAIPDGDDGETRAEPGIFDDYDDPSYGDPNETHVSQTPFEAFEDPEPEPPRLEVPRTPPLTGPDTFEDLEQERPQVPRTPPFTGPDTFEDLEPEQSHGGADLFFIPRTPPNTGPEEDRLTDDANATHISPIASRVAEEDLDSGPRPLFRDEPHADDAAAVVVGVGAAGALGAANAPAARATATRTEAGAGAGTGAGAGAGAGVEAGAGAGAATAIQPRTEASTEPDEFEYFQPGDDMPPPVFPQTAPAEAVDRGRIARYAIAAVVVAAAAVLVVYTTNHKDSKKSATPPPTSSSSSTGSGLPPAGSPSASDSSIGAGAVTAPTATDSPTLFSSSSTASKPAPPPPPSTTAPASTTSHSASAPPPSSAAPPSTRSPAGGGGGGGGVSSLSVGSLSPDQAGSYNYTAHVHVVTRGPGAVTVTVTFAGSQSSESAGSIGASSHSYTLSGKTSYDLTPSLDVHGMCPAPYIDVVVTASGAPAAVTFASSPC